MTRVITWDEMAPAIPHIDLISSMRDAFKAYSNGEAVIPPVGEMQFTQPPGDVHLKYGYLKNGSHYVVKIASGFYENPTQYGVSSSQGLMLLFSQATGIIQAILLDQGHLTDIRTAAAGALTVALLAPPKVACIGMMGTGIQAQQQLKHIAAIHPCRALKVWGRTPENIEKYIHFAKGLGFTSAEAASRQHVVESSQIIITTTPATSPLIEAEWIQPGTHITSVGADTPDKQELDGRVLALADIVVSDSLSQASSRGEVFRAIQAGHIDSSSVVELGEILNGVSEGRTDASQITIADLTGVAVQDLAIATAVMTYLSRKQETPT